MQLIKNILILILSCLLAWLAGYDSGWNDCNEQDKPAHHQKVEVDSWRLSMSLGHGSRYSKTPKKVGRRI